MMYLNDIETYVLVEGVEDELCEAAVAPGAVYEQQFVEEAEL